MMNKNCLICNEDNNVKFTDKYKFEVDYDVNYFDNLEQFFHVKIVIFPL